MKQLAGRGGGFFVGGKRMRGFGIGPPGLDDGRFAFYDGMGPEFGYPGGRFPGDFFPGGGPGGPQPNMSFNPAGTRAPPTNRHANNSCISGNIIIFSKISVKHSSIK